jgi:Ca2+-binding EF-hand superfamily protein
LHRLFNTSLQEFDADGSGFITVDEFLNTMHKRWLRQNEAEIDLAEGTAAIAFDFHKIPTWNC